MAILRETFPIFETKAYINSCSYGALSNSVHSAMSQYLDDRLHYGERWPHWVDMLEELRGSTAKLLGASTDEIALTASLSAGLNALVSSQLYNDTKRKIVCTEFDFPTTAQIWHGQSLRGAELDCVALDSHPEPDLAICEHIDDATAVVSVPLVCFRHGVKLRLDRIIKKARAHDALIVLDAYQAVGSMHIDVKELDVDVLLGGYLKYLLGTAGMGYMYVSDRVQSKLQPTSTGWFAQEDVNAMSISANTPSSSARKFEGGTPNISAVYACLAGLEVIHSIGINSIESQIDKLTSALKLEIANNGWQLATDGRDHGPMIAIRSKDMYALVEKLCNDDIIVSCRDNNIRVSPHFYNSEADIDRLVSSLKRHAELLL